jgi:hypothetical protein
MPSTLITNPTAAFGLSTVDGVEYYVAKNTTTNATITAGLLVIADNANPGGVKPSLHTSTQAYVIGVAMDTITPGSVGRVQTGGFATVTAGATGTTAGVPVQQDGATDGCVAGITNAAVQATIGVALATTASGNTLTIWVNKA